ncbi:heavy metal-associated domain-containing protein [Ruminococcus sp. FC2018]|uniref:heavy-metal-associated domain-containing protein n=1 Tax=Ruminococcus sp. FC2018 TaxID=1410617 RepID=UPI00048B5994|nr:heavy metal-associated domain-containing protein [Ruminococcus sp. FC2018]
MYKTTLNISGMMCSMCEAHINDAIRKSFDVKKVSSSHKNGITEIISQEQLPQDKLQAVIAETGYELGDINSETYHKKGLFGR